MAQDGRGEMPGQAIRLIVNADDYGYFSCVSRGILQAARAGAISATGILANGPQLQRQLGWLGECGNLDVGIHLNLTSRQPLTAGMAGKLAGGHFPGVFSMARKILAGRISLDTVRAEWQAQIETVLRLGLPLRFLNSHEHIHMLPGLFGLAQDLAREHKIPHVRLTRADWLPPFGLPALLRNSVLQAMAWENQWRFQAAANAPVFIGLSRSGKLDLAYLQKLFAKLKPGVVYELMCHPGVFDPAEISDPRLLAYHAWEGELALLTSPQLKDLYDEFAIRIVNYP